MTKTSIGSENVEPQKKAKSKMLRALGWLACVVATLGIGAALLVWFTVETKYTSTQVREWVFSIGTLIGGILSASAAIVVASIGFRSQRDQAAESEKQWRLQAEHALRVQNESTRVSTKLQRIGEQREAVAKLLATVSADLGWMKAEIGILGGTMLNHELMTLLDTSEPRIRLAHEAAKGAFYRVPDAAVRAASNEVYESWGRYASGASEDLANEVHYSADYLGACRAASSKFFAETERYLLALDQLEDELLSPSTATRPALSGSA